jgi:predicted RNA-binding protein with PUA-like domain
MASRKIYDVVTSTGTYNDPQTGEEKKRWLTVGVVFENDAGYVSMKLDAIPAKRNEHGEMWLSLFTPKPREQKQAPQQQGFREQSQRGADGFEDKDIPDF